MSTRSLQPWQVITGGICGLVLCIGLARFAYTPILPLMQAQTGLSDAAGGGLAAINYLGYMSGALLASWLDDGRLRQRLYSAGLLMAIASTAAMGFTEQPLLWAAPHRPPR
jgi:MFS family permease